VISQSISQPRHLPIALPCLAAVFFAELAHMTHMHAPAIRRAMPLRSYHTDPSGTYVKYRCMAIGSGSEGAQTALQEHYKPDMSLADAEVLALSTLKQVMEEKVRQGGCFFSLFPP
jgi:hypothetical protein